MPSAEATTSRRLGLVGASGRMGGAVARLVEATGHELVPLSRAELAAPGEVAAGRSPEVLIDFSLPEALPAVVQLCEAQKLPLVSGVTGIDAAGQAALDRLAATVPVLWEKNMSPGMHVLAELSRLAASALDEGFDTEIVEVHHRQKRDAPSGSAIMLAEALDQGVTRMRPRCYGREGAGAGREPDSLGIHALRGGQVLGDHTVHLLGGEERLELTHRALSREVWARGALRAALWMIGRPAKRYGMRHVLGWEPA